jgi:hypothetical protein
VDAGVVRQPDLREPGTKPRPQKKPRVVIASIVVGVLFVVLGSLGWFYWLRPSKPAVTPRTETGFPAEPTRSSTGSGAEEVKKKVNAAITEGDFYYENGEYDRAIATYQEGLAADTSNVELSQRVQKAGNAKATESSAPP